MKEANRNKVLTPNEVVQIIDIKKANILEMQNETYDYYFTVNDIIVPSGGSVLQELKQIGADADLQVLAITGTYQELDENDVILTSGLTDDVKIQIKDAGSGNTLSDFVSLPTILTPGRVGNPIYKPLPFRFMFMKSNNIDLSLIYNGALITHKCKCHFTFYAKKLKGTK